MTPVYFWTAIFLVGAYLVSTDPRYAQLLDVYTQHLLVEIKRRWLMFTLHPRNPITNFLFEMRMKRLAKQLAKEYNLPEED